MQSDYKRLHTALTGHARTRILIQRTLFVIKMIANASHLITGENMRHSLDLLIMVLPLILMLSWNDNDALNSARSSPDVL